MTLRPYSLVFALLFSMLTAPSAAEQSEVLPRLKFCVEDTEFPPFNYFKRIDGEKGESAGYDVDLLKLVFEPSGIEYKVVALPWRRCLKEASEGIIDAVMSASLNPQRAKEYFHSDAYYYLNPSYFYLRTDFPDGLDIQALSELESHGNICGIKGFNYVNFGWINLTKLYEINEISSLPTMLEKKRCRFFLARKETLAGTLALNNLHRFERLLGRSTVPNLKPEPFHMLISRRSAAAGLIQNLFNEKVKQLNQSGELEKLLEQHLHELRLNARNND
ncbi:ABC transporter substrate-binding protein [uncultured Shewanella sp.]|uniref:substrate-binding periplasmic protein n=1 Tax=Shewanella atlantica TaxID=271099 RepID=UPI002610AAE9|nr:ABC transporter substrate-binding protein [uncultured Shewanella sp.]